jgi:hypothetical protein
MAAMLSALRAGRTLPPGFFIFLTESEIFDEIILLEEMHESSVPDQSVLHLQNEAGKLSH